MVIDDGFKAKVRMNRISTEAGQQTVMVYFACLTRFDDEADACARLFFDQVMMDGTGCDQSRQWNAIRSDGTVAQYDQCVAVFDGLFGFLANALNRSRET